MAKAVVEGSEWRGSDSDTVNKVVVFVCQQCDAYTRRFNDGVSKCIVLPHGSTC